MQERFDVIIIGAGTMGSATAWYARRKGLSVLLLEQSDTVPHEAGSHSGQSRIVRKAYFEHSDYVPLLQLAYDEWDHWQGLSKRKLFFRNGLIYAGPRTHIMLKGVRRAAAKYRIEVNDFTAQAAAFPFSFPDTFDVLFEPDAGFVLPERSIQTFLDYAKMEGAILRTGEKVLSWLKHKDEYEVKTSANSYSASKLVFTAGPWTSKLLVSLNVPLKVTRQIIVWAETDEQATYAPDNFPCWMIGDNTHTGVYYGFPFLDAAKYPGPSGIKFAFHHPGKISDADAVDRNVMNEETGALVTAVKKYLPAAGGNISATKTCLYTMTPDEHFILDKLPGDENIILACGFSGHGFKFAPAIGRVISEMLVGHPTSAAIKFLSVKRFQK
jgi:sarcosine oxidase